MYMYQNWFATFEVLRDIRVIILHCNEPVAQLVEQKTFNLWVLGSSPSGLTRLFRIYLEKDSLPSYFKSS
jgi:hypothetical protein